MAHRDDFDQFSTTIDYQNIETLYWDKFPYKVVVRDSIPRPASDTCIDRTVYKEWIDVHSARQKFYYSRKRYCPVDHSTWKSMNNGGDTFSFFFVNSEDAMSFIQKNRKHIKTVFRPLNEREIDVLKSNRKLVLRSQLYYGTYRYCVEFKEQIALEDEQKLDSTIESLFPTKNKSRFSYLYNKRRRLFLNKEADVVIVKLGLHEKIRVISETILTTEI